MRSGGRRKRRGRVETDTEDDVSGRMRRGSRHEQMRRRREAPDRDFYNYNAYEDRYRGWQDIYRPDYRGGGGYDDYGGGYRSGGYGGDRYDRGGRRGGYDTDAGYSSSFYDYKVGAYMGGYSGYSGGSESDCRVCQGNQSPGYGRGNRVGWTVREPRVYRYEEERGPLHLDSYASLPPPRDSYGSILPPRDDYDRRPPPRDDYDRRPPPRDDYDRRPPPRDDYDRRPPPRDDYDRRPPRDERRSPPRDEVDRGRGKERKRRSRRPEGKGGAGAKVSVDNAEKGNVSVYALDKISEKDVFKDKGDNKKDQSEYSSFSESESRREKPRRGKRRRRRVESDEYDS